MKTRILTQEDLRTIVAHVGLDQLMDEMIAEIHAACTQYQPEQTVIPVRSGFQYESPTTGLIEWMPLMQRGEMVLLKVVGYHPRNARDHGLPTILSTYNLYDPRTGHLIAIADGTLLTSMRTGAASAVATTLLASEDSRVLGLIGCGAQSVTQAHAISRQFELTEILIADSDPDAVESFASRVERVLPPHIRIRPLDRSDIIRQADILCTSTSVDIGGGPVFEVTDVTQDVKPWLHINAVGSDFPGKTEVPLALLKASVVIPDTLEQARQEGECQQLDPSDIGPTLSEIAAGKAVNPDHRRRLTVFDSTGWALEDQVAMMIALRHADALNLSNTLEIEMVPEDPRQPYDFPVFSKSLEQAPIDTSMSQGTQAVPTP